MLTKEDTMWMTLAEVAKTYRVSTRTVRRLVADGCVQHVRVGRQLRFPPDCFTPPPGYALEIDW